MISNRVCVMVGQADSDVFACAAKEMAKNGYVVAMISDETESVARVADEICTFGGLAKSYCIDKKSIAAVNEAHMLIVSEFGKCRSLVCFFEKCDDSINEIFGVADVFISDMLSEAEGSVVNVCQAADANGTGDFGDEHISDMTKKMAVTLAENGVRVNAIIYGEMENDNSENRESDRASDMLKENIPMKRFARSTDIVGAMTYLSDAKSACYTTGNVIYIDGGMSATRGRRGE